MTNWQSLETAPKDGTPVLVAVDYDNGKSEFVMTAHYSVDESDFPEGCWIAYDYQVIEEGTPTFWMPIPTPPSKC